MTELTVTEELTAKPEPSGYRAVSLVVAGFEGLIIDAKDDADVRLCLVQILDEAADFYGDCACSVAEDALNLARYVLADYDLDKPAESRAEDILGHMSVMAHSVLTEGPKHRGVELSPHTRAVFEQIEQKASNWCIGRKSEVEEAAQAFVSWLKDEQGGLTDEEVGRRTDAFLHHCWLKSLR
jgi:hypothetical protein